MKQKDISDVFLTAVHQNNGDEKAKAIKDFINTITNSEQKIDEVANILSSLIVILKDAEDEQNVTKAKELLDGYQLLTKGLRLDAQKNNALKYYYYGIFQTYIDEALNRANKEAEEVAMMDLLSQKYTLVILKTLYDKNECYQSQLAKELKVNRSNLYRIMQKLIKAKWVEQRKLNKCFYSLTAIGRLKYSEKKQDNEEKKPYLIKQNTPDYTLYLGTNYADKSDTLNEWKPLTINKRNIMPIIELGGKRYAR